MRTEKCSKHPCAALGRGQERLQVGQCRLDLWAQLLASPLSLREFLRAANRAAVGTGSCPQVNALQLEPSSQNASSGADGTPPLAAGPCPPHGGVSWEGVGLLSHFQGLQGKGSFQHPRLFCWSTTILGYYYSSKLAH